MKPQTMTYMVRGLTNNPTLVPLLQSGSFYTMPNLRQLELQLTASHLNLSLATLLRENAALTHLVSSIPLQTIL